jgi:hypothetical protein
LEIGNWKFEIGFFFQIYKKLEKLEINWKKKLEKTLEKTFRQLKEKIKSARAGTRSGACR